MRKEADSSTNSGNNSKAFLIVWMLLIIYCIAFAVICANPSFSSVAAEVLLMIFSILSSAYLLVRHKLPSKAYILLAIIMSAASALYLLFNSSVISLSQIVPAGNVFVSALAVFSVIEAFPNAGFKLIRVGRKYVPVISIIIGIVVGIIWGAVNVVLMKSSNPIQAISPLQCLICALRPAIWEEVSFRAVFYAFCISLFEGDLSGKRRNVTTWTMMILPHVLPHTVQGFRMSVPNGIINVILLSVLFGSVFVILQKKRDVASAMTAHWIVDFIRFLFFGVPFV